MQFLLQQSIMSYITSPYGVWFPVVIASAIAVISVVAMIHMFSSLVGKREAAVWARIKIYEILLSLILIFIFLFIIGVVFSINFQDLYNSAGFVSQECQSPSLQATDFFSLAVCNMHQFNQNVANFNSLIYIITLREALVPKVTIDAAALISFVVEGVGGKFSLSPPTAFEALSGDALELLWGAFVLSQLQLLILSASLVFFSIFMALGFISRMFVVTRSFGGALIALAVGLGVIYPLLVSFTYGYINVGLYKNSWILAPSGLVTAYAGVAGLLVGLIFGQAPVISSLFGTWLSAFLQYLGLAFVGLTLIPFLNFVVIDVFVLDFSQAIGERMDFLSLLERTI